MLTLAFILIINDLQNHQMAFGNYIIRQMIECVIVESKEQIKVVFIGGLEVTKALS